MLIHVHVRVLIHAQLYTGRYVDDHSAIHRRTPLHTVYRRER